jgi:hypothetical protein
MYFVCTDKDRPIAHASLEAALKTLRSELKAREEQGFEVAFNDKLEFELSRAESKGGIDGAPYRMWIEDETGQNVTSRDAAESG